MENVTIKLIFALKHRNASLEEAVIDFYSKYTECPKEVYNPLVLTRIATEAFRDYISTCDSPSFATYSLFDNMKINGIDLHVTKPQLIIPMLYFNERLRTAIWITLSMVQVKNDKGYVNGFREVNNNE